MSPPYSPPPPPTFADLTSRDVLYYLENLFYDLQPPPVRRDLPEWLDHHAALLDVIRDDIQDLPDGWSQVQSHIASHTERFLPLSPLYMHILHNRPSLLTLDLMTRPLVRPRSPDHSVRPWPSPPSLLDIIQHITPDTTSIVAIFSHYNTNYTDYHA
ncbi:hypothetical protein CALVIDRAFT_559560 [Calocera viscosa TUFC12733]|uniref:Uncharacterized protein n=1 Tax=Calocera viscosa (strain TUFC12733) TaxID=1330018 RepID=A0A167SBR6_CALVF|nr:hypothetical protein CALVIDRAFT_559560 [Calocera viscosa TUFC12733]